MKLHLQGQTQKHKKYNISITISYQVSIMSESFEVWNSHTNSPFKESLLLILSYLPLILSLIRPPTLWKVVQSLLWVLHLLLHFVILLSISMFKIEKKSNKMLLFFSIVPINSVIQFIHFNQNKQNKLLEQNKSIQTKPKLK